MIFFTIKEYLTPDGVSYFGKWFDKLNSIAASKVRVAIARIEMGNISNTKAVGSLAGGIKKTQQKDIEKAQHLWLEFKKRKKGH